MTPLRGVDRVARSESAEGAGRLGQTEARVGGRRGAADTDADAAAGGERASEAGSRQTHKAGGAAGRALRMTQSRTGRRARGTNEGTAPSGARTRNTGRGGRSEHVM